MELYPEDWRVALVWADAEQMHHHWCPLYEMDRQPHFDATSCLVVPPLPFEKRKRYVYADFQKTPAYCVRQADAPGMQSRHIFP